MKTIRPRRVATVVSLDSRRAARPLVHREQLIAGQLLPFPSKGLDQRGPRIRWDALAFSPLLNRSSGALNIGGHRRERLPLVKDIINRVHVRQSAPDELSGQGPTMNPVTDIRPFRTICPMGRGVTPTRVRSEIATRLKAARIHAGYKTQKEAADALHIRVDRYEKWESGRTPVPAQYVGPVCGLFNIDANYLFDVEAIQLARKAV